MTGRKDGRLSVADTPLGYYKWFPRDFYSSVRVRGMSFTARAIYRELLDIQWESERLPNAKQLLSILQITLEQWNEFAEHLDVLFPNGQNERLKSLRDEAVERSAKAAKSGSKGGKCKRTPSKRLPTAKQTSSQTETETETNIVDKSTKWNDVWGAFVEHRNAMRKKMTPRAVDLILKKLEPYNESQQIAFLEESIEKGWQTVFPKEQPKAKSTEPVLGVDYMIDLKTGQRIPVSEVDDND